MSKPKPIVVDTSSAVDITLDAHGIITGTSSSVDISTGATNIGLGALSFYEWQLDHIPEDVLKEYYLRKYTKLGRKLSGKE